jgi:cathepsin E
MFSASLVTIVLLALSAAATPLVQVRHSPITLPLSRRVNTTSVHNLLRHDVRRAKLLKARAEAHHRGESLRPDAASVVNQPLDNQAVSYIASVGVGSPPTLCEFLCMCGTMVLTRNLYR